MSSTTQVVKTLGAKGYVLLGSLLTAALAINIPDVQLHVQPLLATHPKLSVIFGCLVGALTLIQNPFVRKLITTLENGTVVSSEVLPSSTAVPVVGSVGPNDSVTSRVRTGGLGLVTAVMVVCLVGATFPLTGCDSATEMKAVTLVQQELPSVIALIPPVLEIVSAFTGPQGSAVQSQISSVQTKAQDVQQLVTAFTSNPSAGAYQNIVAGIDQLVTSGDTALLNLANVTNAASIQKAQATLSALDIALHLLDSFIQSAQTPAAQQAMAAHRQIKLNAVRGQWSHAAIEHYMNQPYAIAYLDGDTVDERYASWLHQQQTNGF
jgi:hypothetical protein